MAAGDRNVVRLIIDLNLQFEAFDDYNAPNLYDELMDLHKLTYDRIFSELPQVFECNRNDDSPLWKYILINCHCLFKLIKNQASFELDSLKSKKEFEKALSILVCFGIKCHLVPGMPQYSQCNLNCLVKDDCYLILKQYNYLLVTVFTLLECMKNSYLKSFILLNQIQPIMNGLYQLMHCPLKKPSSKTDAGFQMTHEIYERIMNQRAALQSYWRVIPDAMSMSQYVKETLVLLDKNECKWFVKAVSRNLTKLIQAKDGIQTVSVALLQNTAGYDPNDSANAWKALVTIFKLINSLSNSVDFEGNICKQIIGLLSADSAYKTTFQSIFVGCLKNFHLEGKSQKLIDALFEPLMVLVDPNIAVTGERELNELGRSVSILHSSCIGRSLNMPNLSIETIKPVINILFHCYDPRSKNAFNRKLTELICKFFKENSTYEVYDQIMFGGMRNNVILRPREDVCVVVTDDAIIIKRMESGWDKYSDKLVMLCKKDSRLSMKLFLHLLNCLKNEMQSDTTEYQKAGRCETIYQSLCLLAIDPVIVEKIHQAPQDIVSFMVFVLKNIKSKGHQANDPNVAITKCVLSLVLLLVKTDEKGFLIHYEPLVEPLRELLTNDSYSGLKGLITEVLDLLRNKLRRRKTKVSTAAEKAILDVCDQHIPVRAHGLLTLTKLILAEDHSAVERKDFILTLFQQSVGHSDSYVYLMAINGLAAMGKMYPKDVLESLTDDYLDPSRRNEDNRNANRLKVGETLVRLTRNLDEKVLPYKSMLLNTFLAAVKDDDFLIRASSLSNLGEVCRILAYKLGPILPNILKCVHDVLTDDPAIEARRASVTVLRQLFEGLERDTLVVLQDHIAEIYQTLKHLYNNNEDEVMKLQAQLALEQLNDNILQYMRSLKI
ncbi:PREDICTED: transport and Golgi organization protein 6 [Nicrophorus vespilloides]|uniref:Transport and Golgi organization protein 6 n=1 Tax=Nicrophorus vespilloides TaxID=110193 RepID=A0ABM1MU85_NICVS|nr:PREDICTED: transport and Golgi organization protein 6 [Nicrophorus vespilloides]